MPFESEVPNLNHSQEAGPSLLHEAQILSQEVLNITSNISVPRYPLDPAADLISFFWHNLAIGALSASNKRLLSISLLLTDPYEDESSAIVLVRTAFESAADLVFIGRDVALLLPQYLRHGLVPTTEDELSQIEASLQEEGARISPRRRWKQLSDVCDALGWQEEYEEFYPLTSEMAHGGILQSVSEFLELTEGKRSEGYMALVLVLGILNHLRVSEIAAEVLGEGINSERLCSTTEAYRALRERIVSSLRHSRS